LESLMALFEKHKRPTDFNAIRVSIASPERIRQWSYGEVKKILIYSLVFGGTYPGGSPDPGPKK